MAAYCQVYRVIHFTSPAGWLPVHRDQLRAQRSVTSMGKLYLFTFRIIYMWTIRGERPDHGLLYTVGAVATKPPVIISLNLVGRMVCNSVPKQSSATSTLDIHLKRTVSVRLEAHRLQRPSDVENVANAIKSAINLTELKCPWFTVRRQPDSSIFIQ